MEAEAEKEEFDEDEDEGFQEMDIDSDQIIASLVEDPVVVSPASNTSGEQQPQSATPIPLDPPSTPEKQPPSPDNISPMCNTGSPSSSDVSTKNILGIYNMYSSVDLICSYSRSLLDLIMLRAMDMWSSSVRDHPALTNDQADKIIHLWEALDTYDRRPIHFSSRH